jgi:site-specific DNA-methyltransferase (adenine-specific)
MMDKLVKREELLPDTIDRLQNFILIGKQKLIACKAEIKAIEDVNLSKAVKDQKLSETQDLATILLLAEAKLGALLKVIPKKYISSGKGTIEKLPSLPLGITKKQSHYAQQLAKYPEIIEEITQRIIKSKNIPRRDLVLREIRKTEREKRKTNIPDLPDITERYQLYCCDIKDAHEKIKANSIDWIITDPPYSKECLELIKPLGEFSKYALKEGGSLVCMIGQSYLPDIYSILSEFLIYNWTCCYLMPGDAVSIWPRKVTTGWKPLLWFVKGKYQKDSIYDISRIQAKDKDHHPWGQSESGMADIVERFTVPGDIICDPFLGAGTTGIVVLKTNRFFIGMDNDFEAINKTKERIGKIINDKRRTNR